MPIVTHQTRKPVLHSPIHYGLLPSGTMPLLGPYNQIASFDQPMMKLISRVDAIRHTNGPELLVPARPRFLPVQQHLHRARDVLTELPPLIIHIPRYRHASLSFPQTGTHHKNPPATSTSGLATRIGTSSRRVKTDPTIVPSTSTDASRMEFEAYPRPDKAWPHAIAAAAAHTFPDPLVTRLAREGKSVYSDLHSEK